MRTDDTPFIADWFVVSLRWLTLLGLVVSLSLGGDILAPANFLLLGLVGWNIVLTVLAGLNRRLNHHREISLGIDLAISGLFFWLQGGLSGPGFWIWLIPLLSSALYFELRGALISAGLIVLLEAVVIMPGFPWPNSLLALGAVALPTLFLGGLFGYLSEQVVKHIRKARQETTDLHRHKQRVDNERLRAIYNLTSTLTATLNYQRVIDSALDLSLSALASDPEAGVEEQLISAALLFSKEEILEIASARRLAPTDMRVTLPGEAGFIGQAIREGEPVLVDNPGKDPELGRIVAFHACGQAYIFPLRSGLNIFGVLAFGHPVPNYFTPDRIEVLGIIGHQAVIAIQNARLYQELADEHARMIEVQEEARKKLARDLHDGPTQSVAAMAMRINIIRHVLKSNPQEASDELVRIEELARRTTKEIRHMLFTLRPLILESQGLEAALQAMAEKSKEAYSQNVTVEVDGKVLEEMEMGKQSVIFYIVEEAMNNARKHAQAENILVRLRLVQPEIALLEIQDNGVGFDVDEVMKAYDKRGSLGMINLRERTELVNGVLDVKSALGKGTRVQVYIPLTEEAADRLHYAAAKRG